MHVVRALHGSVHSDAVAAGAGHGDDAVGLDIQLLLMPATVFAIDNDVGGRESFVQIAFLDRNLLERRRRGFGIVVGRGLAIRDLHVGGEQGLAVRVRDQQNRLGDVANGLFGQHRLVVVDQRNDVRSGDGSIIDDCEAGGIRFEGNAGDLAGRNRRPNGSRVEDVRKRQVIEVPRGAGDFLDAFLAQHVAPDGHASAKRHRARLYVAASRVERSYSL